MPKEIYTDLVEGENGLRIRLRHNGGTGRPVLCVPGIPSILEHWDAFLNLVDPDEFHVHVLERPGWGESTAGGAMEQLDVQMTAMARAVSEIDAPDLVVVAHSFGTVLSLHYALRHPNQISRLLNISGPSNPDDYPGVLTSLAGILAKLPLLTTYQRGWLRDVSQLRSCIAQLNAGIGRLKVPVYLIHGNRDGYVNVRNLEHRRHLLPPQIVLGAHVLDGLNHEFPQTHPEVVLEHLRAISGGNEPNIPSTVA